MSGPSIADVTGAAALNAQDLGLANLEEEEEELDGTYSARVHGTTTPSLAGHVGL